MWIHTDKECFLIYIIILVFLTVHSGDTTVWMKQFTSSENTLDVIIPLVRDKNQHVDSKMDMITSRWLINISFNSD